MKTRFLWIGLVLMVGGTACRPSYSMEKIASQITPGMTKPEVASLFTNCDYVESGERDFLYNGTIIFKTNIQHGFLVSYHQKYSSALLAHYEQCMIYYDTNKVIIGYKYSREGYSGKAGQR